MANSLARRSRLGLVAAATSLAAAAAGAPAQAQEQDQQNTGQLTVVHGLPEEPVDVYLNDQLELEGVQYEDIEGPLDVTADTYTVALTEPGGSMDDPLASTDVDVAAEEHVSVVGHLSEEGEPEVTSFVDEIAEVPQDQAQLTARNTAAADPMDVAVDGEAVFTELANGDEATTDMSADTVEVELREAGTETALRGPEELTLGSGEATVAYAVGSQDQGTLALLWTTVPPDGTTDEGTPEGTPTTPEGTPTTPEGTPEEGTPEQSPEGSPEEGSPEMEQTPESPQMPESPEGGN